METDTSEHIRFARDGAIGRLSFNRPESLNSFTTAGLNRAADLVSAAGKDPDIRVVLLSGEGRAFSSGAYLSPDGPAGDGPTSNTSAVDAANRLILAIRDAPKPVVAAVHGPAAGVGSSIAFACDLVMASESAYFLLAFANIGLMPDGGGTALVPAAAGRMRAARMAFLAERIGSAQALEWGLISHVVPDLSFHDEVEELAERLAIGPTASYAQTKRALHAASMPALSEALDREREGQSLLSQSTDFVEGVQAFKERRKPHFIGR